MEANNVETVNAESREEVTIDLMRILKSMWHFAWLIVLLTAVCAFAMFGYTKLFIDKTYSATAQVFVANKDTSSGSGTTSGDVAASLNLVETYAVILKGSEVMGMVSADLKEDLKPLYGGLEDVSHQKKLKVLTDCISAKQSGDTQILNITVTTTEPELSAKLASSCANTLVSFVSTNLGGTYTGTVIQDTWVKADATLGVEESFLWSFAGPSTLKNMVIGAAIGFIFACGIIVLMEVFNKDIYNDEYLIETYNLPVLAAIPDFEHTETKKGYYKYGYGYRKSGGEE